MKGAKSAFFALFVNAKNADSKISSTNYTNQIQWA